jgi:hypothetical protein
MRDTTFWSSGEQAARLAKSDRPNDGKNDLVEFGLAIGTNPDWDRGVP